MLFDIIKLSLIVCALGNSISEALRPKRVVEGVPLMSRSSGYSAVRYYVFISSGHECDVLAPEFLRIVFQKEEGWELYTSVFGMQCQPTPSKQYCSGALLTPTIVQTACHCLAAYVKTKEETEPRPAKIRSAWETVMRVYIGKNSVEDMHFGFPVKHYIVHPKCSELGYETNYLVYDYGWMTLLMGVDEHPTIRYGAFEYAPMYTQKELWKIWRYTLERGLVCLHIGFGMYKFTALFEPKTTLKSPVLRHGWSTTVNYETCYKWTNLRTSYDVTKFNYSRDATWSCSVAFPEEYMIPARGDSGGPVTCDNQYFAIVSMTDNLKAEKGYRVVIMDAAIAFSTFENAIEYRRAFMNTLNSLSSFP